MSLRNQLQSSDQTCHRVRNQLQSADLKFSLLRNQLQFLELPEPIHPLHRLAADGQFDPREGLVGQDAGRC